MASIRADITRRRFFSLCAGVVAVAAGSSLPVRASAAPVGSIVLGCLYDDAPLVGDTYAIARVATAELDEKTGAVVSFMTCEPFASLDLDWGAMSSSEVDEAARKLSTLARRDDLFAQEARSDGSGNVGFWGLEAGLYLVDRISAAEANEAYACEPMLIGVPTMEDGAPTYYVTSHPKFEHIGGADIPTEEPGDEPKGEPDDGLEQPPASSGGGPLVETGDALKQLGGSLALIGTVSLLISRFSQGGDDGADAGSPAGERDAVE